MLLSFWLLFLYAKEKVTGRYKARTCDPLNVVQVRYQLRQSPTLFYFIKGFRLVGSLRYLPSIFRYSIEKRSPCQSPTLFYFIKGFRLVGSLRYLPLHFSILNRKTESLPIAHAFLKKA